MCLDHMMIDNYPSDEDENEDESEDEFHISEV